MLVITSPQNPRIKQATSLNERRERKKTGLFLIEGYRELSRAYRGGVEIKTLFYCEKLFLGENEKELIRRIQERGAEIIALEPPLFEKLSYRDRPDGLVAIATKMAYPLTLIEERVKLKKNPLLLIAESIEKPGNLGTILRSSDAVGADGVIVCDPCTDIYNPNVVRASVGTLFTIPVVEAEGKETLSFLRRLGFHIVAATPGASTLFTEASLLGKVAIIVGTEQTGLSPLWMNEADVQVKIPMKGVADSLNVATATTLLLYEALRQNDARS